MQWQILFVIVLLFVVVVFVCFVDAVFMCFGAILQLAFLCYDTVNQSQCIAYIEGHLL